MKEEVFYLRWPKEINYTFLPQVSKSPIPIFPRENYYLKDRNVEIYGMINLLPCTIDTEDMIEDKKLIPIVDLTKSALSKSTSIWQVRKLNKIPKDAILIEIEKEKIDNVMNAYEECEKANEAFGKELLRYQKKHPNLKSFEYTPKVNPFEYQRKFCKVCEEVFIHSTISKSVNSQ